MKNLYTAILILILQLNIIAQWVSQPSGVTNPLGSVHFVNQGYGYIVGSEGLILHTTNGGENWHMQTSGTTAWFNSVFFSDLNNGWAVSTGQAIFHTTNGGTVWFSQSSGTTRDLYQVVFVDSLHGWICGDAGVMLYTPNGGTSWISLTTELNSSIFSVNFIDSYYGWAVGALGKIIRTTNGGVQWTEQTSGTTQALASVFFTDSNNGWVTGNNGIILRTTNGGIDWFSQTSGTIQLLISIHFTSEFDGWAVGTSGTILHTTDGGNNWLLDFDAGWQNFYSVFFVDSLNGWAVGEQGMIYKYSGEEMVIDWCNLQNPPEHTMSIYDSVEVFARVFVDSITILPGPSYNISAWIGYNNENTNPNTWSNWFPAEFNSDVGANDEYSGYLSGLDVGTYFYASRFQIFGGEFYYGGYPNGFWDGTSNVSGVLNVNSSRIIEWCNLAGPPNYTMTRDDSVEIFAQVFVDGVTNLTGQGEGILAWIGISSENSNPSSWSNWILADYNKDIGGNDEYSSYLNVADTGTYYYATRFQIDQSNYYYGGYPNGFWNGLTNVSGLLHVTPTVNIDENNFTIFDYSLFQNYPNPFNPTTKIKYSIPTPPVSSPLVKGRTKEGFVSLKVYDVLGNEVATLVNEEKSRGEYEVEFNATELPSGIYFYQLKAGSFVQTKKMVLLK